MLLIVMHNNRSYLESLVAIANGEGITDTTIVERKNIGSSLTGDSINFFFHKGGIVNEYNKALIAILKEADAKRFLDIVEKEATSKLSSLNSNGFICVLPFKDIKSLGLESFSVTSSTKARVKDYLNKDRISLDIKAENKTEAITQLSSLLKNANEIVDYNTFLKDTLEREKNASTAVNNEIAIPHARSEAVKDIVIAFGISKKGVDFGASDTNQVKLIFLIGTPKGTKVNAYLEVLAELSKKLHKKEFKDLLLNAKSPEDVIKIFNNEDDHL